MVRVEERFMIQELFRNGVCISEIARRTGHDRKTVRSIINGPLMPAAKARPSRARKVDPFVTYLEKRIEQGVLNAEKLYQEIRSQGYKGTARSVRRFIKPRRTAKQPTATVRFETEPGQQAQVDWGSFGTIGHFGRQRRLYAFVMTLGWSRAMYIEFTVSMDETWWLRCHLHAFHYFGGVPHEVLHDNLKTAVLERTADDIVHWHPRYLDFARYYGFSPRACRPYRAQTKGKVESGVKYVRGNFWPGLFFDDLADLNRQGRNWLDQVANVRVHGTTGEVPFSRLSQEVLQPLAGKPDYDTSLVCYRRSTRDCLVSYEGNYYSVPASHARQRLLLKETERGELDIYTLDGAELACHALVMGHRQKSIITGHYQLPRVNPPARPHSGAVQTGTRLWPAHLPDAPHVEKRALRQYEAWAEVTAA